MKEILLVTLAYFIGSIPTALIISKSFFNIDIRDYGSGNMGATNAFRILGAKWGTLIMALDIIKGMLAVGLCYFMPHYMENDIQQTNFMIALGLAAVIGHIFPVFAEFKGGKGVATLLGMLLAVQPLVAVACLGVFIVVLFLTRYVSLSSILGAIMLPISVIWIWNDDVLTYRIFAVVVAFLVIITHQKNIGRLIKGAETRVPILRYRDRKGKNKK